MDLTVEDVAGLLGVSEKLVKNWADLGTIPGYKLNDQYRFSCDEVEAWMISPEGKRVLSLDDMVSIKDKKLKDVIGSKIGTHAFSLFRSIHKGGVIMDVEGEVKKDVIAGSVEIIAKNLGLDASVLTELLLERENLMPTCLNHGVAVPHTRDFIIEKPFDVIAVVYPKKELDYGALDKKRVHTLFFLFASDEKRHLHLLSKLSLFTKDEETLRFLKRKPDTMDLLKYVKDWESSFQKESLKR